MSHLGRKRTLRTTVTRIAFEISGSDGQQLLGPKRGQAILFYHKFEWGQPVKARSQVKTKSPWCRDVRLRLLSMIVSPLSMCRTNVDPSVEACFMM